MTNDSQNDPYLTTERYDWFDLPWDCGWRYWFIFHKVEATKTRLGLIVFTSTRRFLGFYHRRVWTVYRNEEHYHECVAKLLAHVLSNQ